MKYRGQISVEALVGVVILLLFLLVVLYNNSLINETTSVVESTFQEKNTCLRIMRSISSVYATGPGTEMLLDIDYDALVKGTQKVVIVNDEFCSFLARTNDTTLLKGTIEISNTDGVITFAQISS